MAAPTQRPDPSRRHALCTALAWPAAWALGGCTPNDRPPGPQYSATPPSGADSTPVYAFAVHPLLNPLKLHEAYSPLIAVLNERVRGARFEVEASTSYTHFEEKLRKGQVAFALPNPYQAVLARDWGYHVIGKVGGDEDFKGLFIARTDSPVQTPDDLRGQVVSYPAPTALAAAMLPQLHLQRQGIDVGSQLQNRYVGTHESSIMNAYLGQSAVAATWPPAWRRFQREHPQKAQALKVLWSTEPLVHNAIIVRDDVPQPVAEQAMASLVQLRADPTQQALLERLEIPYFERADDSRYEPVRAFLQEFERKVRRP